MFNFNSVSELVGYTDELVSEDERLSSLSVTGEISGLNIYRQSGHCYFTLKDDRSQVSCAMFSSYFQKMDFRPEEGMKVTITGTAGVYSGSGRFQIKVYSMKKVGAGDISEQMKILFKKLSDEGLFRAEHKKSVPMLPGRIGIVTSPQGAVIHDIINTLNRRNPRFDILIYPAAVQGPSCPGDVIKGIRRFKQMDDIDVIIIARGGGSTEDLWGFNDEALAREIYACDKPVISAVGHETDFTICDYVADLRAPTPTAAAELVMSREEDLINDLINLRSLLDVNYTSFISSYKRQLDHLKDNKALLSPLFYVNDQKARLSSLKNRITASGNELLKNERSRLMTLIINSENGIKTYMGSKKYELSSLIDNIDLLGPSNILRRGYSYVSRGGSAVTSVKDICEGEIIDVVFADGTASARIESRKETEDGQ